MDTDNADDLVLLANTQARAESLLHSVEKAAGGIGLLVNASKTECMCFKREGAICILSVKLRSVLKKSCSSTATYPSGIVLQQKLF